MIARRNHAAANTSNGAMSCVRSTIGAAVLAAITPFIAATYGSRVPKSVSSAIRFIRFNILRRMFSMAAPPPQRLLVFARVPELGQVKTRLVAAVGPERALAIYESMVRDVLQSIGDATPETEIEIVWA